jgi:4-oxalocrotonate tautomerase
MPHVIVKLYSGKSERQKQALARALTEAVMSALNYGEESLSVGIEDVEPKDWTEQVYKPDIIGKPDSILQTARIRPALNRGYDDYTQTCAHLRRRRRFGCN